MGAAQFAKPLNGEPPLDDHDSCPCPRPWRRCPRRVAWNRRRSRARSRHGLLTTLRSALGAGHIALHSSPSHWSRSVAAVLEGRAGGSSRRILLRDRIFAGRLCWRTNGRADVLGKPRWYLRFFYFPFRGALMGQDKKTFAPGAA